MLCETWISGCTPDRLINISGYKVVRKDRPRNGRLNFRYGGVALYIRESLETEVLPTPVTGVHGSNLESVWVTIRVGRRRRVIIGSVY